LAEFNFSTPVLFLVFNRPETTKQVFEAIRQDRPKQLFIAADGPRSDRPDDKQKCEQVLEIVTAVDWKCDVKTLLRESNLGCQQAVSGAINWFFENVEEGIILEDDCLPDKTFFRFCQELLERYRNDKRIFVVSGNNFQQGQRRTEYSYYFSLFNHCWGWATFKRAWEKFDFNMQLWPEIKEGGWLLDILHDKTAYKYWERIYRNVYNGKINSWAYRWTFSCWLQNGLTILPCINMVKNIGFDKDATHTKTTYRASASKAYRMDFPLVHPPFIIRDVRADRFTQKNHFANLSLIYKIFEKGIRSIGLKE